MGREIYKHLIDRLSAAYAMGHSAKDMQRILDKHYKASVQLGGGEERPTLLYVYMDTCGHCQRFHPQWDALVQSVGDRFNLVKVEVNDPTAAQLVSSLNVTGVPAFFFSRPGSAAIDEYGGPHTAEAIRGFLLAKN